ncbi:MAG: hypothetical protein NZM13_03415 [Cyclobacteriaceae bacterium]|nr:hypothetical protein [Cyclobacteriaceae bacterium]MDW8331250.1 hypothetical protein [Cyclobacteriaceae bacterium]
MATVVKKKSGKRKIQKVLNKALTEKGGVDTFKYCGSVKLKKDPLIIQKELRNEWE